MVSRLPGRSRLRRQESPMSDVSPSPVTRHDWKREEILALFALPFTELVFQAATVHRQHFDPREVQVSTLLSVKTGGCPEACSYRSTDARGVGKEWGSTCRSRGEQDH